MKRVAAIGGGASDRVSADLAQRPNSQVPFSAANADAGGETRGRTDRVDRVLDARAIAAVADRDAGGVESGVSSAEV